ncbi:hypothetical protein BT96DRAFT_421258 [Gymnopus androsaceus JB14]|uniref:Uncharacterized protein n=1 Tax=Gymnopus androsaceus JB14 TaxID=1447944 RepID=A0A6A4GTW1_9AGAR|nr:hypothetical protein BT96DRAFT_421258 [Gymnopus androsaceus JB14]
MSTLQTDHSESQSMSDNSEEHGNLCDALDEAEDAERHAESDMTTFLQDLDFVDDSKIVVDDTVNLNAKVLTTVLPKTKGAPSPMFVGLIESDARPPADTVEIDELEAINWD